MWLYFWSILAVAVPAILFVYYAYLADDAAKAEARESLTKMGDVCASNLIAIGSGVGMALLAYGVAFILWGFPGAYGLFGVAVFLIIAHLMGKAGGTWVGPDAEELNRRDLALSVAMTTTLFVLFVVTIVVQVTSNASFPGFCPWPTRGGV